MINFLSKNYTKKRELAKNVSYSYLDNQNMKKVADIYKISEKKVSFLIHFAILTSLDEKTAKSIAKKVTENINKKLPPKYIKRQITCFYKVLLEDRETYFGIAKEFENSYNMAFEKLENELNYAEYFTSTISQTISSDDEEIISTNTKIREAEEIKADLNCLKTGQFDKLSNNVYLVKYLAITLDCLIKKYS